MTTDIQKINPAFMTPRERPEKNASIPILPTRARTYHVNTCTVIINIRTTRLNVLKCCVFIVQPLHPLWKYYDATCACRVLSRDILSSIAFSSLVTLVLKKR